MAEVFAGERPPAKLFLFLEMIKFPHSLFALPFAIGAAFLAARGTPDLAVLGKIVLAVVAARTAAMSFNRLVDRRLDAKNPRTAARALPKGDLSPTFAAAATLLALALFFFAAWWLNPLAFQLSPVAALVILGYSLTKRFTLLCHLFLGVALALAPLGAWVAVAERIELAPVLLAVAVLLWSAGFDVIYACLDTDFDRAAGLRSIPARLGVKGALRVAAALHFGMAAALLTLWYFAGLGGCFLATTLSVFVLLVYEHRLVSPADLSRVNRAFFVMNAAISLTMMAALIVEAYRA